MCDVYSLTNFNEHVVLNNDIRLSKIIGNIFAIGLDLAV